MNPSPWLFICRTMYWSRLGGRIMKAAMDGTAPMEVITGLKTAAGVVVDSSSPQQRLFWVDHNATRIQSGKLDGTDIQTVAQLPPSSRPWGIAVRNDQLLWGNYGSKSIQVSSKSGENLRTLYSGTFKINHLALAMANPIQTRRNHCEGQSCSGICVLSTNYFRCLP